VDRGDGAVRADDGDDSCLSGDRYGVVSSKVDSQGIATVLYSRKGGVLQVRLSNGCAYCYRGVPRRTHDGLLKSRSMEKYLRRIKRDHGETEIDRPGIKQIRIQNFRSIKDKTVRLGDLTVLIGANGTGKTSALDALELFLSKRSGVSEEDYYHKSMRIDITVTVNPGARAVRKEFLRDGVVNLRKSFTKDDQEDGKTVQVEARRNRDFRPGGDNGDGVGHDGNRDALLAPDLKKLASQIRQRYPGAPAYTTKPAYLAALAKYEHILSKNPSYADRYDTEFVAYVAEEGEAGLDELLGTLIPVPAARDIVADGQDGPRSLLSHLLDMTARAGRGGGALEELRKRLEEAHGDYERDMAGSLKRIGRRLERRSRIYMDRAGFKIELDRPKGEPPSPRARVRLRDNGHLSVVENAGSGFQRVYLLSLLDLVARVGNGGIGGAAPATRLFVIDEPELYQHPQRQRRILRAFLRIAEGNPHVRIVCSTHSPYFVELRRVDTLRLLRKGNVQRPRSVALEGLVRPMLGRAMSKSPDLLEELSTWLDMNATHWITEGFFARMVAMVEGPGDRNMLLAAASAAGVDLAEHEISIVPADGVKSVPKFMHLFAEFGIPVYPIWNLDRRRCKGRKDVQERNRQIAELGCGIRQREAPHGTIVNSSFACFEDTLTESLAGDLRACADLLAGSREYRRLERAGKKGGGRKRGRGGERARGNGHADKAKTPDRSGVTRPQKKFLNSKLNVFKMLREVREKSPGRLEGFEAVRVVRMLDALGKGGRLTRPMARATGRGRMGAGSGPGHIPGVARKALTGAPFQ